MTSCQSCYNISKILGPLKHGLMANKPNCNIPPLAMYSGQTAGGRGHEFGKWTAFSPHPSLLLLYPSQYGDIISLTVSTQVHLVIHIIKETKTTDVFLNLEVCIKTCLLLCMFLCCREVGKCPVTPLSLSRSQVNLLWKYYLGLTVREPLLETTDNVFVLRE